MRKVNQLAKVIQKIQEYIGNPCDMVNKARLFDNNLAKVGLVLEAKVVAIFTDYACKIESLLEEMRSWFTGLELEAASLFTSLERIANLAVNMKVVLLLGLWNAMLQ